MVVCKSECPRPFIRSISIGDTFPVYATASGKVILANLSEKEIDRYFSSVELIPLTQNTITDPKVLRHELEKIRASGVAYSRGELYAEAMALAAPVFDVYGKVIASINITIEASRFTSEKKNTFKNALSNASVKLSYHLGFSSSSN
jgi:IclR family acetate operon transcriptional repressor